MQVDYPRKIGVRFSFFLALITLRSLHAQLSPLPLEEGNYWIFDKVLEENRTVGVGRMEVHEKVKVLPVTEDTYYWFDWQAAFGDIGDDYYKLSLTGKTRFFPEIQPDTLLVREDSTGNIWCRGYILETTSRITVEEQPWLLGQGEWEWHLRLASGQFSVMYERLLWIGKDKWASSGDLFSGSSHVPFAKTILPDLTPDSSNKVLIIIGSGGSWDVVVSMLTGIGPIWMYLPTDQTELLGIHLELSEARIGDHVFRPSEETAILQESWGRLKVDLKLKTQ